MDFILKAKYYFSIYQIYKKMAQLKWALQVFIEFMAAIRVYSAADLLRQQLIMLSAPGLNLGLKLKDHSVSVLACPQSQ